MGTDGACGLLFGAAKRSGAFPPNMPAGLRARVSRLGGFTRPFSGLLFPPAGARLFVITGFDPNKNRDPTPTQESSLGT
jgi:hypothetical protein